MESLLREIVNGERHSGEHLVTQALARRFEVSHTPVREALVMLAGRPHEVPALLDESFVASGLDGQSNLGREAFVAALEKHLEPAVLVRRCMFKT